MIYFLKGRWFDEAWSRPLFCSFKGLAKLGNIVAETLLQRQMFPSLAARETYVTETNFAARKQQNVFFFCLRSKTILLPGHKFCFRNICFLVQPP